MATVLQQIVDILVGGLTNMATGIAGGLNTMATQLFVTGTGTTSDPYQLTVFGGIIAIFAGVSLAVGLTTLVTRFIMSFGGRN